MDYKVRLCCLCSATIDANPLGMCTACANSQINITEGITTQSTVTFCRTCQRYSRPPWVRLKPESNEMMSFLISKIKGLKAVKLTDSNFIWTEPHSKKIKIKLTVQKEVDKILKQSAIIVEYTEEWTQCDDCKKTFTPHLWNAAVQVRQKVDHKRTFLYIEQAILKHKMHEKALNVKETPEGVDFYFKNKSHACAFSDFIHSILPTKAKTSKQLVSHDQWSNLYNYKYTYMLEIAPVCKDDIIILTQEQLKELGGIGPVMLCYKTSTNVHLMDPLTMEVIEFDENTYWRHNFRSFIDRSTLEEFIIQNIDEEIDYSKMYQNQSITESNLSSKNNLSKSTNYKNTKHLNDTHISRRDNHKFKVVKVDVTKLHSTQDGEHKLYSFRTHLGDKVKIGDIVYGYDLTAINVSNLECDITNFPEVILVKLKYVRGNKRVWKLKRMKIDDEANEKEVAYKKQDKKQQQNKDIQYEEFLRDIEEDPELRKNVNLYKDNEVINDLQKQFESLGVNEIIQNQTKNFGIEVEDLMSGLKIDDEEEVNVDTTSKPEKNDDEFAQPKPVAVGKKIKKNADVKLDATKPESKLQGKRNREGSHISSSDDNN